MYVILVAVLSGKELFNYNASLFIDDDAAISATEEKAMNAETQEVHNQEDEKSKYERERAMADQQQLLEIYRLEDEERQRRIQQWKELCEYTYRAHNNKEGKPFVFPFCNVTVNGYVFAVEEEELLDLFEDEEEEEEEDTDEEEEDGDGEGQAEDA